MKKLEETIAIQPPRRRTLVLCAGAAAVAVLAGGCGPLDRPQAPAAAQAGKRLAAFGAEQPPGDVRHIADWVADSRDNQALPFAILDKVNAKVYVFDANAQLRGASAVLLGTAPGDHTVPGIGERKMSDIRPHERTTPAGRFVAEPGRNLQGEDIVWVDYDAAVSMHRVRANKPEERRLERLASPTPDDNRISYGCINVPVRFFDEVVSPSFRRRGVVYVLPETRPVRSVFRSYDVALRKPAAVQTASAQAAAR
jgi:hypothetical protein